MCILKVEMKTKNLKISKSLLSIDEDKEKLVLTNNFTKVKIIRKMFILNYSHKHF